MGVNLIIGRLRVREKAQARTVLDEKVETVFSYSPRATTSPVTCRSH